MPVERGKGASAVVAEGRQGTPGQAGRYDARMADPTPQDIERFIAAGLACDHVEVEGDGRHFFATIVSPEFEGSSRIARQKLVYRALGERMREEIHALSMKTLTPAEYRNPSA
jgi:acid stress-induced BolA-like protein IbaG/YrbA